jgi:hypothetical protein
MGEQGALTLLALALETGEVQRSVAPDKLRAYAVREPIGIVVETIAAVLDDGKISAPGLASDAPPVQPAPRKVMSLW